MNNPEMKSTRAQFRELCEQYDKIKDELLEYTEYYHDGMYFDLEGYYMLLAEGEYDEIETLRNQVDACRLLLEANKKLDYRYC